METLGPGSTMRQCIFSGKTCMILHDERDSEVDVQGKAGSKVKRGV